MPSLSNGGGVRDIVSGWRSVVFRAWITGRWKRSDQVVQGWQIWKMWCLEVHDIGTQKVDGHDWQVLW